MFAAAYAKNPELFQKAPLHLSALEPESKRQKTTHSVNKLVPPKIQRENESRWCFWEGGSYKFYKNAIEDNFYNRPISLDPASNTLACIVSGSVCLLNMKNDQLMPILGAPAPLEDEMIIDEDVSPIHNPHPFTLVKYSPSGDRLACVNKEYQNDLDVYLSFLQFVDRERDNIPVPTEDIVTQINDVVFRHFHELYLASDRVTLLDLRSKTASEIPYDSNQTPLESREKVCTIKIHPNGYFLAVGTSRGRRADVWDIRKSSEVVTTLMLDSTVKGLDWNPRGDVLASIGAKTICIYNVNSQEKTTFRTTGHQGTDLRWYDGETLVTSHYPDPNTANDPSLKFWHYDGSKLDQSMQRLPNDRIVSLDLNSSKKTVCVVGANSEQDVCFYRAIDKLEKIKHDPLKVLRSIR